MKLSVFLIAILVFFSIIPVSSVRAIHAVLRIEPASSSVAVGDEFALTVVAETDTGLFGVSFDMQYDATILEYVRSALGSFMGNDPLSLVAPGVGYVTVAVTMKQGQTPAVGTGNIAAITFKGKASGTSTISFRQDNLELKTADGTKFAVITNDATVTVAGKEPALAAQVSPDSIPADGISGATIIAALIDTSGAPLSGQNVTMVVTSGQGTMSAVTDNGDGTYTGIFTAGNKPGNVTVTISALGTSTTVNINLTPFEGRLLVIPEVTGSPGEFVNVPINITDASGVAGADINVMYDATILKITEISNTTLSSGMSLVQNINTPGEIILRLAQSNAIPRGSGALVNMVFIIDAGAAIETETPIIFEGAEVFDASALNVAIGTQDGKVTVVEPACMEGDVDADGSVKSNDAILALQIAAGFIIPTPQQLCAADMNNDNKVKSNDAILILQRAAGLVAPGKELMATKRHITVMLDEAYGEAGESITVPLRVDNTDMLAGGDIVIAYNSSVLRAVDVSSGDNILLAGNVSEPGMVRIAFAAADRLKGETIARIRFDVIANDVSPLTIQSHELYDHDGIPLKSGILDKRFISYLSKPEHSALFQNFPNPFNPDTWIPYQLAEDSEVAIWILSIKGEVIRKLNLGLMPTGIYTSKFRAVYWDGKDDSGTPVASGVYFYSFRTSSFCDVKKMLIIK